MRTRLEFRTSQQQRLSASVHNLIQLLTLSNLELSEKVAEMLEENPLLELDEDAEDLQPVPLEDDIDNPLDDDVPEDYDWEQDVIEGMDATLLEADSEIDAEVELDDLPPVLIEVQRKGDSGLTIEDNAVVESLLQHLERQLMTTSWPDREKQIARKIFQSLDQDGYLSIDISQLASSDASASTADSQLYEKVLHNVQSFTPSGIGARDLQESLLIQLRDLPSTTDLREHALDVVERCFEELAARNVYKISQLLDVSVEEANEVLDLIRTLNPRPAAEFRTDTAQYIEPDVAVLKREGQWVVELVDSNLPSLRITPNRERYQALADSASDRRYIKQKEIDAKMLLDGIAYRSRTILKTAEAIVAAQQEFFERGEEAMRPLVRSDIANEVGVHESTISRITTNKYMTTPRGTFELGYFFSSKVMTRTGTEVSSTAIRAMLRELIEQEDPLKPLSDQKLMNLLLERNIKVARRTVTKYRESMSIPSSTMRMERPLETT